MLVQREMEPSRRRRGFTQVQLGPPRREPWPLIWRAMPLSRALPIYNLGMILRSEGRFTAPPFARVVMVRIYQEGDGFHIYAKPWFARTYDSKLVEICGPMREPAQRTLEFAKYRAKHAIEGNISVVFGASYVGNVDWNDGLQYLRLLKPLCKRAHPSRR